jgi:hypothetical protein
MFQRLWCPETQPCDTAMQQHASLLPASREHHQWQNMSYRRLSDGDRDNHTAGGNGDAQATIRAQCWVSCPEPTRTWKWAQAFARQSTGGMREAEVTMRRRE